MHDTRRDEMGEREKKRGKSILNCGTLLFAVQKP